MSDCRRQPTMNAMILGLYIAIILLFIGSSGFLLDTTCSTGNICRCRQHIIECANNGLIDIPTFNIIGNYISIGSIDLRYNAFNLVRNNAFTSLANFSEQYVNLYLDHNNISSMEDMCFSGLTHTIVELSIRNNRLQSMPMAIASLTQVTGVYIENNPLMYLDPHVFSMIGNSIVSFSISLNHLQRWPQELHYLNKLAMLSVYNFNLTLITKSDFSYLTHLKNLISVEISDSSSAAQFPTALCDLSQLAGIRLINNSFINKSINFFSCQTPFERVNQLHVESCNFDILPDIGKTFPNVQTFNFENNAIQYITNELTIMRELRWLYLDSNKLIHFPSILGILAPLLRTLSLKNNRMIDLDNLALNSFTHLRELYLDNNPLEYIELVHLHTTLRCKLFHCQIPDYQPCPMHYQK